MPEILIEQLKQSFKKVYEGESELLTFFSPGRVNLIGEHIDYNGGCVFPCAITYGTYAIVSTRDDQTVQLFSENFKDKGILSFELTDLAHTENEDFSAFVKGVVEQFTKSGYNVEKGFNAYIFGNIPNGSGLSSSASLELLTAQILKTLNDVEVDMVEMVKMSQRAENEYVGVNCGIMDQFAIGMGQKDYAIKLNTNDLSYEYAKAELGDCAILIMNTNYRRTLADSKYNERREQCDRALLALQTKKDINFLCDLTEDQFNEISNVLTDEVLYRRARHAVTENERVKLAIDALAQNNLEAFGALLNASHASLKEDYEVTGPNLDKIVELAQAQDGVLGARMTGAGFGGCAIALVKEAKLDDVLMNVAKSYKEVFGYGADFYVANIGNGTTFVG